MSPIVKTSNDAAHRKEEKVLSAAEGCFVRYGFRKTTMGDIAAAAQISRPALYLVYNSKEDVFRAVVARLFATMLAELREGIDARGEPVERLQFAFEVWCVRPFEIVQNAPDAADLLENSRKISADAWNKAEADFEAIITDTLSRVMQGQGGPGLSAAQVAHVLATAVPGFKESARSVADLRGRIRDLLDLVLNGLQARAG